MGRFRTARLAVVLRDGDGLTVARAAGVAPEALRAALAADLPCELGPIRTGHAARALGLAWALPLCAGDTDRGVVLLGPLADGGALDAAEADFAAALAALAVGALETADRVAERVERERIAGELRAARAIQERLLPPTLDLGLDAAVVWRPSREVSGDTYEFARLDTPDGAPARWLVAVADVVGKGLGAALLTATLQTGLRLARAELAGPDPDLAGATARLDRLVAETTEPHQFVTMAWALVDAPHAGTPGRLRAVSAGHPALRLVRAPRLRGDRLGTVERLDAGGPLLGVVPGARFEHADAELRPGDTLVLVTDGATEAQDAGGDEWGEDRLDAAIAAATGTAAERLAAIERARLAFASGAEAEDDDLTLLAVRFPPASG